MIEENDFMPTERPAYVFEEIGVDFSSFEELLENHRSLENRLEKLIEGRDNADIHPDFIEHEFYISPADGIYRLTLSLYKYN